MVVVSGKTVSTPTLLHALTELFPADVVLAIAEDADESPEGYPEEEAAILRAVPSRRREFRLGRACARAALKVAGAAPASLPVGPDRAPMWPTGFVGSITHCDGFIGACVAHSAAYEGIGFDAERSTPLDEETAIAVCTPAERAMLDPRAGKILFAAKEALHKCVAPKSGIMLDFQDVTIDLSPGSGTYRAALEPHAPYVAGVGRMKGRIAETEQWVFALALLRA